MGMRVQGNQGSNASQGSSSASTIAQRQQAFKDLTTALSSGDLSGAQKAFSSLTQGRTALNSNSPLAALGQALQSGNIGAAQQAFQSLQAERSGGHHGHHHGGGGSTQASTSPAPAPAPAPAGTGLLVNTTA